MPTYAEMTAEELLEAKRALLAQYEAYKAKDLKLNMARGKPASAQLDLSLPLLSAITSTSDLHAADGTDLRNYGVLDGIPEAKELMASMQIGRAHV